MRSSSFGSLSSSSAAARSSSVSLTVVSFGASAARICSSCSCSSLSSTLPEVRLEHVLADAELGRPLASKKIAALPGAVEIERVDVEAWSPRPASRLTFSESKAVFFARPRTR